MTHELQLQIDRLQAAEDIRHLKARYADVCDTGYEPARMAPLFTQDAVWDGGERFGRYEGNDAICGFFAAVSSQITWALHYMIAPKITIGDDLKTAEGTWYLWQPCTIDNNPVWLTGTYFDRYAKEDDGWKFSEVHLSVQTISPFDEGWVKRPFLGE